MTMPDLLPCPFCGGEAWAFSPRYDDGVTYHNVRCKSCYVAFDGCATMKIAKEKWNTRAQPTYNPATHLLIALEDVPEGFGRGVWLDHICAEANDDKTDSRNLWYLTLKEAQLCYAALLAEKRE